MTTILKTEENYHIEINMKIKYFHVWGDYRRGLYWIIGFSDTLYIHTVRDYRHNNTVADLHTLQIIITHALGFSVFTSRILATDL
jgi:hypothetical protein